MRIDFMLQVLTTKHTHVRTFLEDIFSALVVVLVSQVHALSKFIKMYRFFVLSIITQ